MKVGFCSDAHLEFGNLVLTNDENADVLVLAGDIVIANDFKYLKLDQTIKANRKLAADATRWIEFFRTVSQNFPHTIYVVGNHEHYGSIFANTIPTLREALSEFENIHLLDKDAIVIDGTTFIGATLWTDLNKGDPFVTMRIISEMSDFVNIKVDTRKHGQWKNASFAPVDMMFDHAEAMHQFSEMLAHDSPYDKVVMVTHHAPCHLSIPVIYQNQTITNYAYYSDLSEFILDHPQIKLAIHGHTHSQSDYQVGDTRVVCNPRGYLGAEKSADRFALKYIDLG